ncbi:MAG: hypothetical protein K2Y21_08130 [Phycisphaerales bacterium]|nr:hypothetical protein [Phycisphaerales bacterium]
MSSLPTLPTEMNRGSFVAAPAWSDANPAPTLLQRLAVQVERWSRWEFWPAWLVYALLIPRFVRLALRHRSATVFAAANPGMPLGGFVGESKLDILRALPQEWIIPTDVIEPGTASERAAALDRVLRSRGWNLPVVCKPDVGERGTDVRLIRTTSEAAAYLLRVPGRVLVQPYHPGPFEAGVFYVRVPGEPCGRIFSITDKRQPRVTGDGRSSLGTLVWNDRRLRLQSGALLEQLGPDADRVPAEGERVLLSIAGNHCRGTMFLDGGALRTDALERRFDEIAKAYNGFYFGRFDVRYSDEQAFARGEGFQIVELNGVLSESTNIYDPSWSLWRGLRTLAEQWSLAFEIGAANARTGARVPTMRQLLDAARRHQGRTS